MNINIKQGDTCTLEYNSKPAVTAVCLWNPTEQGELWYFRTLEGVVFAQNPYSSNLNRIIKRG